MTAMCQQLASLFFEFWKNTIIQKLHNKIMRKNALFSTTKVEGLFLEVTSA